MDFGTDEAMRTLPDAEWLRRVSRAYLWVRTQVDMVDAVLDGSPTQEELYSITAISQWFPTVLESVQSIPGPRSIRGQRAWRHLQKALLLYIAAAQDSSLDHHPLNGRCSCGNIHEHPRLTLPRAELAALRQACARARGHLQVTAGYIASKAETTQRRKLAAWAQAA